MNILPLETTLTYGPLFLLPPSTASAPETR